MNAELPGLKVVIGCILPTAAPDVPHEPPGAQTWLIISVASASSVIAYAFLWQL